MNITPDELYIYTNGVLLSRRLITDEAGIPITPANISTITLKLYKLIQDTTTGLYTRTLLSTTPLTVSDVITATVQTDPNGLRYNFRYCVEGVFTASNTLYLVEYTLKDTNNHTVIIAVKGRTKD